jgi:NDP-sugar pyrophosphorylase family protein
MQGIILAQGLGKKIWPFSDHWQKCALPIGNKGNLLRLTEALEATGIKKIKIVTGYKSPQVKYLLKNKDVEYIEAPINGTADALLAVIGDQEPSIVIYGDMVIDKEDIGHCINKFNDTNCSVILYKSFDRHEQSIDWMCCNVTDEIVTSLYGHPRPHYVNARVGGVFVFDKRIVPYLKANPGYMKNVPVGGMPQEQKELEQSLQMMIEDGETLVGVKSRKLLIDLDKPWHLMEANEAIIEKEVAALTEDDIHPKAKVHPSAVIEGKIKIGENSYIGKNVIIKGDVIIGNNTIIDYGAIIEGNTIIGDHTSIKDYCKISPYTTIGDRNRIGYNAEVQGVTFEGVSITHGCEIYGIVGQHTDIAAGCLVGVLRFDDGFSTPRVEGRKELGNPYTNAVFLGDYSRTGIGNIFFPGVRVGKNCALGPGAIVSKDIPSGSLLIVEQNQELRPWGPNRYGW